MNKLIDRYVLSMFAYAAIAVITLVQTTPKALAAEDREFTAGAKFTLGLRTVWSKSHGSVTAYVNGEPVWNYAGPTMYNGAEGVYLKWGASTSAWRLANDSRSLYQVAPDLSDCGNISIEAKGGASISNEMLGSLEVHNFTQTTDSRRAEFRCSNSHTEGETTYHERTIILPHDWVSADDATTIMQYHAYPGGSWGGANLKVAIYRSRLNITLKNSHGTTKHRVYRYTPLADKPVADEPVADEPVADEPVADEPVADEPVADEPVADEPTPVVERDFSAGAEFTLGFRTVWSKSHGSVTAYLNDEPIWNFKGPTMYDAAEGVYLKWGAYTNTWRLAANSRYLYQVAPDLSDCYPVSIQANGDASIKTQYLGSRQVHNFYETIDDHRAEFKCANKYVEGETTYHERTFILPDDWVSADDATTIMQYHAYPGGSWGGPNLQVAIYRSRINIIVKNSGGTTKHRVHRF